jgi:hypothetical protein
MGAADGFDDDVNEGVTFNYDLQLTLDCCEKGNVSCKS